MRVAPREAPTRYLLLSRSLKRQGSTDGSVAAWLWPGERVINGVSTSTGCGGGGGGSLECVISINTTPPTPPMITTNTDPTRIHGSRFDRSSDMTHPLLG